MQTDANHTRFYSGACGASRPGESLSHITPHTFTDRLVTSVSKGLKCPLMSKFSILVMLEVLNNVGGTALWAVPGINNIPLKVASGSMKLHGGHVWSQSAQLAKLL